MQHACFARGCVHCRPEQVGSLSRVERVFRCPTFEGQIIQARALSPAFHWVCSSCLFCLRSSIACWPVVSTLSVAIGSSSLLFPVLVVERNQVLFSASGSRADLGNAADAALKKKSSPGCEGRLYLDRIYRLRSCPGGRRQRRISRLAPRQEVLWMKSSTSVEEHTAISRYISGSSYGEPFFTLMYLAPSRLFTREGQVHHRKMNPGHTLRVAETRLHNTTRAIHWQHGRHSIRDAEARFHDGPSIGKETAGGVMSLLIDFVLPFNATLLSMGLASGWNHNHPVRD